MCIRNNRKNLQHMLQSDKSYLQYIGPHVCKFRQQDTAATSRLNLLSGSTVCGSSTNIYALYYAEFSRRRSGQANVCVVGRSDQTRRVPDSSARNRNYKITHRITSIGSKAKKSERKVKITLIYDVVQNSQSYLRNVHAPRRLFCTSCSAKPRERRGLDTLTYSPTRIFRNALKNCKT